MIRPLIWLASALIVGVAATAAAVTNQFNVTVTVAPQQPPSGLEIPGPSAVLYANNPYYTCTGNRYVAVNGNWQNSGLDTAHPWDLQGASGQALPPGTCINVAPGVYVEDEVDFQYSGTNASKTGYIVWRCTSMPFSFANGVLKGEGTGCVLKMKPTNQWYTMRFRPGVHHIMIDGFEFDGTGNPTSTVCLSAENNAAPINHHIWVFNSDFHGCGQSGMQLNYSDWVFVIHNVWHHNSDISCVMGSGLSIWQPVTLAGYEPTAGNSDYWHSNTENLTYHNVMVYNVGYHNFNPQGPCGATANTDGEMIILDSFDHAPSSCPGGEAICPSTAPTLVMGNIAYDNGGHGLQVYLTTGVGAPITFVNNTMFSNDWDKYNGGTWRAGSYTQSANNIRWYNNISVAVRGTGITQNNAAYLGQQNGSPCPTGNIWKNNLAAPTGALNFDGGNCNTFPVPPNKSATSAGFTNQSTTSPNFGLTAGSAAVGMGAAFDLWQQSGTVDAGACPRSAPGPTTSCP